jgi:putative transposase
MPVNRLKEIRGPALVFVSTTVIDWAPILTGETASVVIRQFAETTERFKVSIIGYVLMPSHLHALLGFREIKQLSKFMQSFKGLSSRAVKGTIFKSGSIQQFEGDGFKLWKRRFDDVIIESEKQFRTKLDYIHTNPVRAGLVESPTDWVYSSAKDWLTVEMGPVRIDKVFSWHD